MPRQTVTTTREGGTRASAARPPVRRDWTVEENHSDEQALERKQRRVGVTLAKFALAAVVLAGIGVALVTRSWVLFGIALLVFIPFLFIIMAPLWLARTTQVVQRAEGSPDAEEEGPIPPP